jgi:GT2 family glycosyltransferase
MGFLKSAWESIGGFDESFDGVYGWEDCDFGLRLFLDGSSIAWLPTATVNCQKDERHESIQARAPLTHSAFVYGELKWRNDALILWNKHLGTINTRR